MFWNGASFSNDQFSQITITSAGGATSALGPAVRVQSSGENCYALAAVGATIQLQVESSGVNSSLASYAYQVVPGDVLRLEVQGTTLTAKLNGKAIITATNSAFTSGAVGILALNTSSPSTGDDWIGGPISLPLPRIAVAYLTGPGHGFLLGSDTAVTTGLLEQQSGGPFSAASVLGGYTLSAPFVAEKNVANVLGQVTADGNSNVNGTVDEFDAPSVANPEGVPNLSQPFNPTINTLAASGRGTMTTNSPIGFPTGVIFYVVSPGSLRMISSDAGGQHPEVIFLDH